MSDVLGDVLRQCRVFPALHVQTLNLSRRSRAILNLDGGVLLLLQKEKSLEDAVQVDLEELVPVVHRLLERSRDLQRLSKVSHIGVDEHRIGISVDDLPQVQNGASERN